MLKRIISGFICLAVIVTAAFLFHKDELLTVAVPKIKTVNTKAVAKTVIIDAGHGGLTNTID